MSELAIAIWLVGYGFTIVWGRAQTPWEQRKADAKESPGPFLLAGIITIVTWLVIGPAIIRGF